MKSGSGDHRAAVEVLRDALGPSADTRMVNRFAAVVSLKDRVSYTGSYFRMEEALRLLSEARTFCAWAEDLYARRPVG